ncbi:MAG: aminotransferase class III-fold pyridoxal phosphate-dependent enzyme [Hydrogenophaga sp.]|nr:aminotransferase class III-fold pyridoxal phosphate-dependent enzyme [Hydrogenophaga sp.]
MSVLAFVLPAGLLAWLLPQAQQRLQLSRAKHRSLAGHARMAKRLARWLPGYAYDEEQFFRCDGAPAEVAMRRRTAFMALAEGLASRSPRTLTMTAKAREGLADLQFTGRYRVPFQFSPVVAQHLRIGAFMQSAEGVTLTDLDGNRFHDLTGSYGVNVFGTDFYRRWMDEGSRLVEPLGATLGAYHPCVADNVDRLREISGMDEVSFHMSGTEAVMQAVRLARFHTRRRYLVRFPGAYHGWWEDVQPGPGNPLPPRETYTLADMSERSLRVLRRRKDIACVLVNPLQALHPNRNPPADSALVDSSREAHFDREAYTAWLRQLRQVCTERGIVLIFDEVFLGFRLAPGGAQEYFGVKADMVTYGKTLGGGFPVGVVCGRHDLMQRFRPERPADLCLARGTFNAHPHVMGAMSVFLQWLRSPEARTVYEGQEERWDARARRFNAAMEQRGLPIRVAHLHSIWTVNYTQPSRYNWMLQYYLRRHGVALSWVGTGRLIFSLNHSEADFDAILQKFIEATAAMREDGWWHPVPGMDNRGIRRRVLRELLAARFGRNPPV